MNNVRYDLVAERTTAAVRSIRASLVSCLVCPGDPVIKDYLGAAATSPEAAQKLIAVVNHIVTDDILSCPIAKGHEIAEAEKDQLRRDNAALRASQNELSFALETIKANIPDASKLLAQAHEEYTRRQLAPLAHDRN